MSRDMAKYLVEQLEKNFSRKFPKAGIEKVWPDMLKESSQAMEAAFDYFALNSAFLPSPAMLLSKVQAEGKRIRMEQTVQAERAEKAKEIASDGNALERAARDEHAKFAIQGIAMMRRTDKTDTEKLEFFRIMDERYPRFGWAKYGMLFQKDREFQKTRPHWRDVNEASVQFQMNYRAEQEKEGECFTEKPRAASA